MVVMETTAPSDSWTNNTTSGSRISVGLPLLRENQTSLQRPKDVGMLSERIERIPYRLPALKKVHSSSKSELLAQYRHILEQLRCASSSKHPIGSLTYRLSSQNASDWLNLYGEDHGRQMWFRVIREGRTPKRRGQNVVERDDFDITGYQTFREMLSLMGQNPSQYLSFVNSLTLGGANTDLSMEVEGHELPVLPCSRFLSHMHVHEDQIKALYAEKNAKLESQRLARERRRAEILGKKPMPPSPTATPKHVAKVQQPSPTNLPSPATKSPSAPPPSTASTKVTTESSPKNTPSARQSEQLKEDDPEPEVAENVEEKSEEEEDGDLDEDANNEEKVSVSTQDNLDEQLPSPVTDTESLPPSPTFLSSPPPSVSPKPQTPPPPSAPKVPSPTPPPKAPIPAIKPSKQNSKKKPKVPKNKELDVKDTTEIAAETAIQKVEQKESEDLILDITNKTEELTIFPKLSASPYSHQNLVQNKVARRVVLRAEQTPFRINTDNFITMELYTAFGALDMKKITLRPKLHTRPNLLDMSNAYSGLRNDIVNRFDTKQKLGNRDLYKKGRIRPHNRTKDSNHSSRTRLNPEDESSKKSQSKMSNKGKTRRKQRRGRTRGRTFKPPQDGTALAEENPKPLSKIPQNPLQKRVRWRAQPQKKDSDADRSEEDRSTGSWSRGRGASLNWEEDFSTSLQSETPQGQTDKSEAAGPPPPPEVPNPPSANESSPRKPPEKQMVIPDWVKQKYGRKQKDKSWEEEQRRKRLAQERREKALEMYEKLRQKRYTEEESGIDLSDGPRFEDYGWLAQYCIFQRNNLELFKRTFEAVDDQNKGYLGPVDTILALRAVNNKLSLSEEEYLYRIMELAGYKLSAGTDFKLYAVMAALSQRITTLDDWMKHLIGRMDFSTLERKLFMCRTLWECNVDPETNTIPIDQLCVELRAGGVSYEHEQEVREKLGHLGSLDLLDFMSYVPLFIMIHESVVDNPLNDTREK